MRAKEDKWQCQTVHKAESHFADARFFEEDDTPKETMSTANTSSGKGSMKNVVQVPKEDMPMHQL